MADYQIKNVGTADVSRKALVCNFSINSGAFFDAFGSLIPNKSVRKLVKEAIDNPSTEVGISRGDRSELNDFFAAVQQKAEETPSTKLGFAADEQSEAMAAEDMKRRGGTSETITYHDEDPSTAGIETYDSSTGQKEGEIILGPKGNTGMLVPLQVVEKVETHYEFNAEEDIEEDRKTSGQFIIKNPSDTNKIWDVDVQFEKDKPVSIEESIHINNLDPSGEEIIEYELEEFEEPALKIHEFISTLNDVETETYSLSLSQENVVLFKIHVKNIRDYPLRDILIKKEIIDGYMNVDVLENTLGETESNVDNFIEWKIEKLEPEEEATLSVNMTIEIPDRDYKPKTGPVTAEYYADKALTGIQIDKFDAYSDNFVAIEENQLEDDPDKYACRVWFENESDFQVQLVNLDVIEPETNNKVLDIDPSEIPPIASGATWKSVSWETETEDGMEPKFHKTIEFFLISEREVSTMGSIVIDDIELAVAMVDGKLDYSTNSIASYRVVPFDVLLQVKNTGGADLNELILKEVIQEGYIPPNAEDVELYIVRPQDDDDASAEIDPEEEIDWEDLGEQISLAPDMIEITPEDPEAETEHTLAIKLEELRESPIGMITPGTLIRAKYTITANKPARGTEYVSNVVYTANTYPAGAPIELVPEAIHIPVEHKRTKILKGKKVRALATEGHYEITLTLRNTGENVIENLQIRDVVPENFEYGEYSQDPSQFENLEGKDLLIWEIEELEANGRIEITYNIMGVGDDYKASEAQFSV